VTVTVEWETATERLERCDHEGTTEPLDGITSISLCRTCRKTWPTKFGKGAPTVRVVSKRVSRHDSERE
jgi:hypothetical protein